MKKLLLALVAVLTVALPGLAADKLVFYNNTDSWNNLNMWVWNDGNGGTSKSMTSFYDNYYYGEVSTNRLKFRNSPAGNDWANETKDNINLDSYPKAKCWAGTNATGTDVEIILNGEFKNNGWQDYPMSYNASDMTFSVELDVAKATGQCLVKFKVGNDTKYLKAPSDKTLSTTTPINFNSDQNCSYNLPVGKYKFVFDVRSEKKLTVTEVGGSSSVKYYLDGAAINGWNKNDIELTQVGSTNVYKATGVEIKNLGAFGVRAMDGSTEKAFYWASNTSNKTFNNEVEKGKTYTQSLSTVAKNSSGNNGADFVMNFTGTNYAFELNLDYNTLTITGDGIKDPVITPEVVKYALKGQMFGISGGWDAKDLKSSNGKWVLEDVEFGNGNEFGIQGLNSSNEQKQWIYGETSRNEFSGACTLNTVIESGSNGKNWKYTGAKATYNVTFDPTASTLTIAKSGDPQPNKVTVYFNAGADWYNTDVMNKADMYAYLLDGSGNITGNKIKMTKLEGPNVQLPLFSVDVENPSNYGGVRFECTNKDNNTLYYTSWNCPDYDKDRWYMFIYNTGDKISGNALQCYAAQSFVTYETYERLRNNVKENVYYIGGGIKGLGFWNTTKKADVADGVFVFPVDLDDNGNKYPGNITFKMSWMDADGFLADYNAKYGKNHSKRGNRWWSTFNLGLVGPTLAPEYYDADGNVTDKLLEAALTDEQISKLKNSEGVVDGNYSVKYKPNRTRKYSRYNNYNWWITKEQLTALGSDHYIVIDTENKTSAFIPFKPEPALSSVTAGNLICSDYEFTLDDEAQLGNVLAGSAIAGEARINKANEAVGTATMKASTGISLFDPKLGNADHPQGYDVVYSIFQGEGEDAVEIASFDGVADAKSYKIVLNQMILGQNQKIAVRATYHDLVNNTSFRSLYKSVDIANNKDLPAPQEEGEPEIIIFKDGEGWNAYVKAGFMVSTQLAEGSDSELLHVYPDFEFAAGSQGDGVRLVKDGGWAAEVMNKPSYTMWESGPYDHDTQNWATMAFSGTRNNAHHYTFHFVFTNIVPFDYSFDSESSVDLKVKVFAAYPFLVDVSRGNVDVTPCSDESGATPIVKASVPVRRKAAGDANKSLAMSFVSTPLSFTARSGNLSGITDAEIANGDGEAEYFNLQGVRVQGDIVPGVYIVRRGEKVTKEIIR